jgi:hypothetical protein
VQIPDQYRAFYGQPVHLWVVLSKERQPERLASFFEQSNADLTGYRFDRDKA